MFLRSRYKNFNFYFKKDIQTSGAKFPLSNCIAERVVCIPLSCLILVILFVLFCYFIIVPISFWKAL